MAWCLRAIRELAMAHVDKAEAGWSEDDVNLLIDPTLVDRNRSERDHVHDGTGQTRRRTSRTGRRS